MGQSPRKVALLIGISQYAPSSTWKKIHADNDLKIIREALLSQGFLPKDIQTLENQAATKDAIKSIIKRHFFSLKAGDFAYLHFSGHGQQVPDQNGDELDHLDEALVPYDAPEQYQKDNYHGERHLLDDELQAWLLPIRKKLGPKGQLLITLDACHSGTATRDGDELGPTRGSTLIMGATQSITKQAEQTFLEDDPAEEHTSLAPLFLFSATNQKGLNYEVKPPNQNHFYGPLSYAFSKVFPQLDAKVTYETFYDDLLRELSVFHSSQSPSVEGPLHYYVFQGKLKKQPVHYKVVQQNQKFARINVGAFAGILPGSVIGFYPKNTVNPEDQKSIYTGVIQKSQLFTSDIILDESAPKELMNYWAYTESLKLDELAIKVKLNIDQSTLHKQIVQQLPLLSNLVLVEKEADLTIQKVAQNPIQIFTARDQDITPSGINNLSVQEQAETILNQVLLPYAQAEYLRRFNFKDRFIKINWEIIPQVEVGQDANQKKEYQHASLASKRKKDGRLVFNKGDKIKIKVSNSGQKAFYFSIFDIQPDNKINLLVPGKRRTPEEYYLAPGHAMILPHRWTLSDPYGQEVFKIIALDRPVNILQPYTRGDSFFLPPPPEKGKTRGEANFNTNIPPNTAHVESLLFFIDPKSEAP